MDSTPFQLMSFQSLNLNDRIYKAILDTGYEKPTEIQVTAIPVISSGRDVIGIAQTGTGKTAAFVLPILSKICENTSSDKDRKTRVLIIAPTRELVSQINQNIRTYAKYTNLRTVVVTGGVGEAQQIERLNSNVDIVIATPGRLQELMDRRLCKFDKLEYLVLDEADRMLDMGFLPAIEEIVKPLPNKRQTLLFSATLSKPIERLAKTFMVEPRLIEIGNRMNPAKTVKQFFYPVAAHLKAPLLLKMLDDHALFSVIVFVRTKQDADLLTRFLRGNKIDAQAIHGDKKQLARVQALKGFKETKLRVLVATDVASRGLDIQGVTHVVNFDFPEQNDDYIHRIGRTGRAGESGIAFTFLSQWDDQKKIKLEKYIGLTLAMKLEEGFDYDKKADEDTLDFAQPLKDKTHSQKRSKYSFPNKNTKSKPKHGAKKFAKPRATNQKKK